MKIFAQIVLGLMLVLFSIWFIITLFPVFIGMLILYGIYWVISSFNQPPR